MTAIAGIIGVCLLTHLSGLAEAQGTEKKYKINREDIVIAFPADVAHLVVAKSSRVWRKASKHLGSATTILMPRSKGYGVSQFTVPPPLQGKMRTFIAHSAPPPQEVVDEAKLHNETWGWYPDDWPKR
jgi:hypothetical protein